jgi:hypothetical protein
VGGMIPLRRLREGKRFALVFQGWLLGKPAE